MSKIALAALLILAVITYTYSNRSRDAVVNMDPSPSPAVTLSNRYLPYSDDTYDSLTTNRRVLFFYASWCPTCIPADLDIETNQSQLPKDLTVVRVNYNDPDTSDTERALAKKYGITYQHTFVQIDANGNIIKRWNGGKIKELLANLE